MNKEYLPFFNSLEQKYKDAYMEWSKEQLIDHLVANIKNGEVLLSRIEKTISDMLETLEKYNYYDDYSFDASMLNFWIEILKGETK